jgi:hypothetical protein
LSLTLCLQALIRISCLTYVVNAIIRFLRSCERYSEVMWDCSRFVECHRWFSEGWKLWRVRTPWLLLKHYSVYERCVCTVSS